MPENDTIAAIATAAGRGAIGIVRISGPRLERFVDGIIGGPLAPRQAKLVGFRAAGGDVIDQGLALFFPAPHSYTGESVLELHGHGGPVVMREILRRCVELGARVARPGEFTERAFLNDRLDLAQAEAVADLIDAATAEAARSALRSLQGAFSRRIDVLIRAVIELRALVEATLDFPEEEIDFLKQSDAEGKLLTVRAQLREILAASHHGSLLREGIHIVLAGQPNVGKSSLLNRLAGEELAIVTDIPGTTRDAIRQTVSLSGVPAHLIDTAGLRDSDNPVEKIGVSRTWDAIAKADLVLVMLDGRRSELAIDEEILARLPAGVPRIMVINKIDLAGLPPGVDKAPTETTVRLSAKTGEGVDQLGPAILEVVGWRVHGEGLFMARERHLRALTAAQAHLDLAVGIDGRLELLAEELRLAQEALGEIIGEYTSDDLLGEIFGRFCIGK